MCLSSPRKLGWFARWRHRDWVERWKIMTADVPWRNDPITFPIFMDQKVVVGVPMKAERTTGKWEWLYDFAPSFHVFTTREGAEHAMKYSHGLYNPEREVIIPVMVKGMVAEGEQYGRMVQCFTHMVIPSDWRNFI